MLNMAKERNRKLSIELSELGTEIKHLSNRPERQLYDFLKRLDLCKSTNDRLHQTIQNLEEQITKTHKDLEEAKNKLNKEDAIHLTLMRMNLRIHQLKQMEIKARSLQSDQCMSIQTKRKEWTEAMNKMDLLSQAWANERQAKIAAVQKLRENLKFLSSQSHRLGMANKLKHMNYFSRSNNNGLQTSDSEGSHLPHSLFSALCKEIRRLQSRSVSLVEALDLLSSGNYNTEKLDHMKSLVLNSNVRRNTSSSVWKNTSLNSIGIGAKSNRYNNTDLKLPITVRSINLRNNSIVSVNSRSTKKCSNISPTSSHNQQLSILDKRRQRVISLRMSNDNNNNDDDDDDGDNVKSKCSVIQEPTNAKNLILSSLIPLQLNSPTLLSQKSTEQQSLDHSQSNLLQQQHQQQEVQQLYYHYNLPLSFSPRVQRRPVSFYLSRSIDKFAKFPILEADEEEQDDDDDDDDDEEEDNEVKEESEENEKHYNNHGKYIDKDIEVEKLKECNIVLVTNQL
ncbi:unnamed protein product [Heterobilharzia americana]|nr:unnamed protein product [Heterobilharzia americana]